MKFNVRLLIKFISLKDLYLIIMSANSTKKITLACRENNERLLDIWYIHNGSQLQYSALRRWFATLVCNQGGISNMIDWFINEIFEKYFKFSSGIKTLTGIIKSYLVLAMCCLLNICLKWLLSIESIEILASHLT